LTLYGSLKALQFAGQYFSDFSIAQEKLDGVDAVGHPEFLKVMASYNRMVWEIRNDAMTWSIFAPAKGSREVKPSFGIEPKI
jgi:hypothetical protein